MRIVAGAALVLVLAGCSQTSSSPEPSVSIPASTSAPRPTTAAPSASPQPSSSASSQTPTAPSTEAFCDYLDKTVNAQQSVEDPEAFVQLVAGAQAVAPGAISEDLALYVQSARKLALTVTGTPEEAQKADAWLNRNSQAVDQAEANLNSYAESTCGRPFIAGEG